MLHEEEAQVILHGVSVAAAKAIRQGERYQACQLSRIRVLGETLTGTPAPPVVRAPHLEPELGTCVWASWVSRCEVLFLFFLDALKPEEATRPHSIGELVAVAEPMVARGLPFFVKDTEIAFHTCCYRCLWPEFIWGESVMANPVTYDSQQC